MGPIFLVFPTVRTVGVGATFSLLLWKFNFVGPTDFGFPTVKTVTSNTNRFYLRKNTFCEEEKVEDRTTLIYQL